MRFYEDMDIGVRRELGSYTFTAEAIRKFATLYDPQRFHLDEEAGRQSLFGGLAASGWHVGSVCMKMLVAETYRIHPFVARFPRPALDSAGARRRHHHLFDRHRVQAAVGFAAGMGHPAGCVPRREPAWRGGLFHLRHGLRAAAGCEGLN